MVIKKWYQVVFVLMLCLWITNLEDVSAGCSPKIDPNGFCDPTGLFEDPSFNEIKNSNCTNFQTSKGTNKYCKTYCREKATTKFPTETGILSADQYDSILGGNHFTWGDMYINTSKECITDIDYDKWYEDYLNSVEAFEKAANRAVSEYHMRNTDRKTNNKCQGDEIVDTITETVTKYGELQATTHATSTMCRQNGGIWKNPESRCYMCSKGTYKNGRCVYTETVTTDVYETGYWHEYQKVHYDTYGRITKVESTKYCDANGKPYIDDDVDNYWTNQYNDAKKKVKYKLDQLKQCNQGIEFSYDVVPSITVNYVDPTTHYTKNVDLKNKLLEKKVDSTPTKATGGSGLIIAKCDIPNESSVGNLLYSVCHRVIDSNYKKYMNTQVKKKITNKYQFYMPENVYRYILKDSGEAVSELPEEVETNHRYIDIGYPNYPVHYTTATGTYPISLTYKNLGSNGKFVKSAKYSCDYKVINRIKTCPQGECPDPDPEDPDGGGSNPPGGGGDKTPLGINVVYRPISLTNPFPGENGRGRPSGQNWTNDDINKYIKNNRGTNTNKVYNKTPLYSFTLDSKAIKAIRNYNKTVKEGYSDFNLTCSSKKNGKQCKSKFLKNITNYGVKVNANTCLNSTDFYGCAGKPNQDKIKCALNKDKKYVCANCATNPDSPLCKEGNK